MAFTPGDLAFEYALKKYGSAALSPVGSSGHGGWLPVIREPHTGAWQQNKELAVQDVLGFYSAYACVTLIAGDMGKMPIKLVEEGADGIWRKVSDGSPYWKVLKKPNRFQVRSKFVQQWLISKLTRGNAYALKVRDQRGIVIELYILDPGRVTPLVSESGDVFYQLKRDDLSGVGDDLTVPAREIIHDTMIPLYHPLVGVSPIYACGMSAGHGLKIQNSAAQFFEKGARPGGVLTAPGAIGDDTATRIKEHWDSNYSGVNAGKVAVLGDGLKFEPMSSTAIDSQLIEQLKLTAEQVCSAFHVPAYKVGVGPTPTYANAQVLNQIYYSDCLQALIEDAEASLDYGLELPNRYGTEFDLEYLLLMDSETQVKVAAEGIKAGAVAPNEGRKRLNLEPVEGGDTPYLQQQNYSLAALARRDAQPDPFTGERPPAPPEPADQTDKALHTLWRRAPETLTHA